VRQFPDVQSTPRYSRLSRRRRLFIELSIGILIIAGIGIAAAGNLPPWLKALGWAAWILWMVFLSVVCVGWELRRRRTRP